jgi:hypothetical protein
MIQELRINRYDPRVAYSATTTWTAMSDIGKSFDDGELTRAEYEAVEGRHLSAVSALMDAAGVSELTVSDIQRSPLASAAALAVQEGTRVSPSEALEICRLELRDELSCRLDSAGDFYVHVGFDYYLYVGAQRLPGATVAEIEEAGLFVERGVPSPYSNSE